jgi:hypothetical protein
MMGSLRNRSDEQCDVAEMDLAVCHVSPCRDSDTEDRNFSPVFLEGGGVVDLAITAMDQGWCMQAYTCQKRLR